MLDVQVEIPGVKLGMLEAENIRVELVVPDLAREMDEACERIRARQTLEELMAGDKVLAVRAMFRAWGVDPARYRPSSEALLRRIVQGKGLYRVSSVVDINNLCSVETGWPAGLYDREFIQPPVTLRLGLRGETYDGIGRHVWHPEGRPVLADAAGPFGSPISDSTRTMIRESTRAVFTVFYAPANTADAPLQKALERQAALLERYAGARTVGIALLAPRS